MLTVELRDEVESRTFRDDPAFTAVLTPLNSQRYAAAITEAKKLLPRYENFDLAYKWLGMAYRATEQLEPSRQILREGLCKSKRKCLLLTDLGETEWLLGNVENGLYWLAQALHCLRSNPIEHNAYLLLSYLAKGIAMHGEADLLLDERTAQHAHHLLAVHILLAPRPVLFHIEFYNFDQIDCFMYIDLGSSNRTPTLWRVLSFG